MQVTIKGTTMTIGERVKTLRLSRDWSHFTVASRAQEKGHDIIPMDIAEIEEGSTGYSESTLKAIAAGFGMSFARLLGFDTQAALDEHREAMKLAAETAPPSNQGDAAGPAQLTLGDARSAELERKLKDREIDVAALSARLDRANDWGDRVLDLLGVDRGTVNATEFALGRLEQLKGSKETAERMLSQSRAEGDKLRTELDEATAILAPLDTIARRHGWNGCPQVETPKAFAEFFERKLKLADEIKTVWRDAIGGLKVAARSEIEALTLTTRKLVAERDAARAELDRIANPRARALSSCEQKHELHDEQIREIMSRVVSIESRLVLIGAPTPYVNTSGGFANLPSDQ